MRWNIIVECVGEDGSNPRLLWVPLNGSPGVQLPKTSESRYLLPANAAYREKLPSLNREDYHKPEATCSFVCPKTEEALHRRPLHSSREVSASRICRYQVAHSPMNRLPLVLLTFPYVQLTCHPANRFQRGGRTSTGNWIAMQMEICAF